jgi:ADP-ribosyl-[dinitrogen reductase] hydrolase
MLGLAVGDAVGTALEFSRPDPRTGLLPESKWLTDMVGGGPFDLKPGEHTDDTSMAIALMDSIVQTGDFDVTDQMTRYVEWMQKGKYSVKGYCFDIGGATSRSLRSFAQTGNPYAGASGDIFCATRPYDEVAEYAREESEITHGHVDSADCCAAFAQLCWLAIRGATKAQVLDKENGPRFRFKGKAAAIFAMRSYLDGPPHVTGSGYVVRSFEAALWAFASTDNYRDAILLVTRLGRDTDTTAAITGQLAGAFYGVGGARGIPVEWFDRLKWNRDIAHMAGQVYDIGVADAKAES